MSGSPPVKTSTGGRPPKERTWSMTRIPSSVVSSPGTGPVMADALQWTQESGQAFVVSQKTRTGLSENVKAGSRPRVRAPGI